MPRAPLALALPLLAACGGGPLDCEPGSHPEAGVCVLEAEPPGEGPAGVDIDLAVYPPVVVRTVPEAGALDVDAGLDRIEIEYSLPMDTDGWSWAAGGDPPYLDIDNVSWASDTLHVAEDLEVEDGVTYFLWLNSPSGGDAYFQSSAGISAVPYPLAFHVGSGPQGALARTSAAVVRTVPRAGAGDVDPALDRIEVTFSKDMRTDGFGWDMDAPATFPPSTGERWEGARTAVLEVELAPSATYALWINRDPEGFFDADGWSAASYLLTFRTRP